MSNIKVCVKIRPLSERDIKLNKKEQWKVSDNKSSIQCVNTLYPCEFSFDRIFGTNTFNSDVYATFVEPIIDSCLDKQNCTILTYGPTSAGKNHTMLGTDTDPGIILITLESLIGTAGLFQHKIRLGYIEIYKEKIYDLFNNRQQVLIDREQGDNTAWKDDIIVDNFEEARQILLNGSNKRKLAADNVGQLSSLSHSILRITIESEDGTRGQTVRHLRFVHVAGCEFMTEAPQQDSFEDDSNKSLRRFNAVINELNEGKKNVDFNSSVLTMLLREPLMGKSNMAIICNIALDDVDESIYALKFVSRVQKVPSGAMCNEMSNDRARSSTSVSITDIHVDNQLKQISNLKIENLLLRKELEDVKAEFAAKRVWYEEQMINAEFDQQKSVHELIEEKSGLEFKIMELTKSNDLLMGRLKARNPDTSSHSSRKPRESPTLSPNENSSLATNGVKYSPEQPTKRKIERPGYDLMRNHKMPKCMQRTKDLKPLMDVKIELRKMTVPNSRIGYVIGPRGEYLQSVKSMTGAAVYISERNGDSDRVITITGNKRSVRMAVDRINEMLAN